LLFNQPQQKQTVIIEHHNRSRLLPVSYTMDFSEYATKTLNDTLGLIMLHMDTHLDPASDPEDWKIWGRQFLEKKVCSGSMVNISKNKN